MIDKNGNTSYSNELEEQISSSADLPGQGMLPGQQDSENSRDVYFADAGNLIIDKEKASIGMLQRMFKIGFNRAARIMDQLCEAGVVGPEEGTKPRKVLMTKEEFGAAQSEKIIEESFDGSLPAFIAAFTSRKKLSPDDVNEIQKMIDSYRVEGE